ncbi:FAD-binding oxidoreductase [Pleomorphomonas sp. JP5]|uniref:NAD(P)/FAD-dependent oxidoreductase n=1 Tax=Pleomorphomonas sp. JP5 TaxID=2942998 RepID=UPI0020431E06|nr:FAD-binding oxidoreductase [Pleomorphomonas sp. JP5]MCM5559717.1 FAD-binding oxidoreductase [Pleomorphomonas sp. JP5]
MGPQVDPVPSDVAVPKEADVVIVGGGIIGTCSALYLAERGLKVVLLEKGHIGCEQSSRNWGWVRQADRDPREFDLIREAMRLWREMGDHGVGDTGFRETGIFFAARRQREVDGYRAWVKAAAEHGIGAEVIEGEAVKAVMKDDLSPPPAGLWCPSDGRAEPQKAAPAVALAARAKGAVILTDSAVRGLETALGEIVSVVTERGTIRTKRVVLAAGAWSRRFLKDLDITLPQLKMRSTVSRTGPVTGGPDAGIWDDVIGIRKRADGGLTVANGVANVADLTPDHVRFTLDFLPALMADWKHVSLSFGSRFFREIDDWPTKPLDKVSPYEKMRILDPKPDARFLRRTMTELKRRFPSFREARIVQSWAGYIDVTPDVVPVISEVDGFAGLVVATGFSGHGFGIGPGAGWLVADLVTGTTPFVDPAHFRLSRFSDGSKPKPASRL